MKQMNTPILAFLLFLVALFSMDAAVIKVNSDKPKLDIHNIEILSHYNNSTTSQVKKVQKTEANLHLAQMGLITSRLPERLITQSFKDGFLQGFFYGLVALLIIFNIISFVLFDEKIYLLYGGSLISLAAFLFFSDGLFSVFDMQIFFYETLIKASFFLVAAIASAIFSSYYLKANTLYPKLKFVATGLLTIAGLFLLSGWFLDLEKLAVVSNALSLTVLICYFCAGLLMYSKKNYAKIYVIAVALPLLFIMGYLLAIPFNISYLKIDLGYIKGVVLVKTLMLTYAILYRMREIKEENINKQRELKIFIDSQELNSREKTEKHLKDEYLENVIMKYDLEDFDVKLLQHISEGISNKKIALKFNLSESDLEKSLDGLYQKLEIKTHIKEDSRLVASQPDYIYN